MRPLPLPRPMVLSGGGALLMCSEGANLKAELGAQTEEGRWISDPESQTPAHL